jgi:transcriptional regulator with XRE-family HTH domain
MTQPDLALTLDVNISAIKRVESGTRLPSLRLLIALARELEVSTDYLLGMTPEPPP